MSTEFSFLSCTGILDNSSMKLDLTYCAFSFSFSLAASSSRLTFLIVEFSNAFSSFRWLFDFLTFASLDFCSSNFSDMNFMLASRSSTLESVILNFSFTDYVCILNFSFIFSVFVLISSFTLLISVCNDEMFVSIEVNFSNSLMILFPSNSAVSYMYCNCVDNCLYPVVLS